MGFRTALRLVPAAFVALLALLPQPAFAAGGDLPPLVLDIGLSLLAAGVLAIVFARLKVPSIAAFLLAGVVVGPLVLNQVSNPASIDTIAQLGFVLLLFTIGLKIDVRQLIGRGKKYLIVGALQFPLTLVFGLLVANLLVSLGIGADLLSDPLAPLYVGVTIAASSSLLVIAVFQQHFDLDTQPGRIALVLLICQDIWAIVVMLIQPNLADPAVSPILFAFASIALLIAIAAVASRLVMPIAFRWIAKNRELTVLAALAWCFTIVAVGMNLDALASLIGIDSHLNVGAGMAALIAGATIAALPFATEVVAKVGLVKDFFVTLFFVGLGIAIPAIDSWSVPILAVLVAILAIAARQIVFFPLLYFFQVDQRTAEVTSIRLAQISEFGLVIAFIGVQSGHISAELSSAMILAFVFTSVLTTPLYRTAYDIYEKLKPALKMFGFKEGEDTGEEKSKEGSIMILGLYREAMALVHKIAVEQPELIHRVVVVDFNVALHDDVRKLGAHVAYGDLANEATLLHAGVDQASVLLASIPDHLLRGTSNRQLVQSLRQLNHTATIMATAEDRGYGTTPQRRCRLCLSAVRRDRRYA
jgi:Kef-type K+ transport system membrane component KefB